MWGLLVSHTYAKSCVARFGAGSGARFDGAGLADEARGRGRWPASVSRAAKDDARAERRTQRRHGARRSSIWRRGRRLQGRTTTGRWPTGTGWRAFGEDGGRRTGTGTASAWRGGDVDDGRWGRARERGGDAGGRWPVGRAGGRSCGRAGARGWAELRDRAGIDHGRGAGARPRLESTKAEVWRRGRGGDKIDQGGDRGASGAPMCSRRGTWAARSAPVWGARQCGGGRSWSPWPQRRPKMAAARSQVPTKMPHACSLVSTTLVLKI